MRNFIFKTRRNDRSWMTCSMNLLMTYCCLNTWILRNQSRMTDNYDNNADSWFDFLIVFCESKMRTYWIKETSRMIDEKDDKTIVAFHRCTMIETNLNALNWSTYHSNCLNDCFFWTLFNHLTYIFNQLQRTASRSWRFQDVAE